MTYELWVKGNLGIHKDKLVLSSVHTDYVDAQVLMMRALKKGKFATIVRKESRIKKQNEH